MYSREWAWQAQIEIVSIGQMPQLLDEIGPWSEIKLDIIRKYASAYNTIIAKRHPSWKRVYIDAFAGPGTHVSRASGEFVPGSPLNALLVQPPFSEHHFIDIDGARTKSLREIVGDRPDVLTYTGDSNEILIERVFPRVLWAEYRRGLCLLDPYGLHLNWVVVQAAGEMKSIELFLNFPIMDINMNVARRNPDRVAPEQKARMTRFWGDGSWEKVVYDTSLDLFGHEEKVDNQTIARAYRDRLREVAGFMHVPEPIPMRNSTGSILYYLFVASQQPVAEDIVADIFSKYR
jgi:three-Cys-motif partner protein